MEAIMQIGCVVSMMLFGNNSALLHLPVAGFLLALLYLITASNILSEEDRAGKCSVFPLK